MPEENESRPRPGLRRQFDGRKITRLGAEEPRHSFSLPLRVICLPAWKTLTSYFACFTSAVSSDIVGTRIHAARTAPVRSLRHGTLPERTVNQLIRTSSCRSPITRSPSSDQVSPLAEISDSSWWEACCFALQSSDKSLSSGCLVSCDIVNQKHVIETHVQFVLVRGCRRENSPAKEERKFFWKQRSSRLLSVLVLLSHMHRKPESIDTDLAFSLSLFLSFSRLPRSALLRWQNYDCNVYRGSRLGFPLQLVFSFLFILSFYSSGFVREAEANVGRTDGNWSL